MVFRFKKKRNIYAKNPHFGFLEKIKWKNANSIFQDFMNSNVVTTVDTMTAPLSEVYFPSAVVCNINQVSEHFFLGFSLMNHFKISYTFGIRDT